MPEILADPKAAWALAHAIDDVRSGHAERCGRAMWEADVVEGAKPDPGPGHTAYFTLRAAYILTAWGL
jgi:hypothetical protein